MRLILVSLCVFYRVGPAALEVWTQRREDDGPFHGLLEFPGGGIEPGETPAMGAIREVQEEVAVSIQERDLRFMGIYPVELGQRKILLYVHLHPETENLAGKGEWLRLPLTGDSSSLKGVIPPPNHRIIEDLMEYLYRQQVED